MSIDLNCDMGEGFPNDVALMPYISSTNVACGFHAGNKETMQRTIELALQHNVAIGAHPGFDDKANFGRTEIKLSSQEIRDLIICQISILQNIATAFGTKLNHVKPHGALYNMAARDAVLAETIATAVKDTDPTLVLYGLSGSPSIAIAQKIGLRTASEVFADRTYQDDGSLTPRNQPNAMINGEEVAIRHVLQMVQRQTITSVNKKLVPVIAETICIHGDEAHAVAFAKKIYRTLQQQVIDIKKT